MTPVHALPDLERLLAPVSAANPSGESLRYSGVYDEIQEARREDDPNLPQGVWKTALKKADWRQVERLCRDALETRSKDLQIAAWLTESWLHLHGIAGVGAGLYLLAGLSESFWDTVHPRPGADSDGDELEPRLAPLRWLEEKLAPKLKQVPITRPEADEAPVCSLADWEAARHVEVLAKSNPAAQEAADAQGRVTSPKFLVSVTLTPSSFYLALADELRRALEALGVLAGLLEGRCGGEAPGFTRFAENLLAIQHTVGRVLQERAQRGELNGAAEETEDDMDWDQESGEGGEDEMPLYSGGPIRSRAEAYRRLAEAADYLLRTEPHSPAPYLVRRAVAWGSLTLSELLQELVQSDADLRAIYTLLGMRERQ